MHGRKKTACFHVGDLVITRGEGGRRTSSRALFGIRFLQDDQ